MESFIISLMTGHLFSKGVDTGRDILERYLNGNALDKILDEFNQAFMEQHDAEISLYNCDMQAVFDKRDYLISCAEDSFIEDNSGIKRNMKQVFIDIACREIGDSSNVVKTYLNQFYSLVFAKEINEVSAGFRALLNAYADSQHDINKRTDERFLRQDARISRISKTLEEFQDEKTAPVDFSLYYRDVEERFTEEKDEESIVGSESDEKAYIDANIETEGGSVPVLPFLEGWLEKKKSGGILIHGEPGHGKTLLCQKAMVDFFRGNYLKGKAKNVIAVSLNTGENRSILDGGKVTLSNALVWGAEQEHRFTFEDCRGSVLFLDGFDEFIDDAKRIDSGFENICPFMKRVNAIAKSYDIHIVVLSRTAVVSRNLNDLSAICNHYELSPISKSQQDGWMNRHPEYSDYKETFWNLRKIDDMGRLLGVPLLFRLIVHSRFDTISSNVVELYDNLFIHLMRKRNIYANTRKVERGLMDLAFDVYCTDTKMAVLENVTDDPHWLFTFYVKTSHKGKIGFLHRTFYQYFLAKFIYTGILNLGENEEEHFIGMFAERELDETVRQYLSFLIKEKDKPKISSNVEKLIIALSKTEAYLNLEPRVETGNAERSKILRSQNIYRNTFHFAAALSYIIQMPFTENLDVLMRVYDSQSIVLISKDDKRADLSRTTLFRSFLINADLKRVNLREADLSKANLREADLREADLSIANMWEANLREADLSKADLRGTFLSGADVRGANVGEADLSGADLSGANLFGANLSEANMCEANLRRANLSSVDLSGVNLRRADLIVANLSGANLSGADLRYADLSGADLSNADLSKANLSGADLRYADLSGADLSNADLIKADLRYANLSGADLSNTDLQYVILYRTKINVMFKGIIDPSADGYSSIEWVSDEGVKQ